jgi:hypothetical protein
MSIFNRQNLGFALLFLLLNLLFFLPAFLVYWDDSSFLPSTTLPSGQTLGKLSMFFARDNQDIFRLSGEFILLSMLLLALRKGKLFKPLLWLTFAVYFLLWVFHLYFAISVKVYGTPPNFMNDWALAREVLPLFLSQFSQGKQNLLYLGMLAVLLVSGGLLFVIFRFYGRSIRKLDFSRRGWIGMALVLALLALLSLKNKRSNYPRLFNSLQWTSLSVNQSMRDVDVSSEYLAATGQTYQSYFEMPLEKKPDVYLLFVESYGEVVFEREELTEPYLQTIREVNAQLDSAGYSSQSILSEAPILGGRSWLAFTSAFCGFTINNQVIFNKLLELPNFPHLINWFNHQGYQTFRIKTMSDNEAGRKAGYEKADAFYGFDRWIKYNDFPYHGYKYDWFGGIPDQFALNYYEEEIPRDSSLPQLLFFINMSSHGPWFPSPPIYEDWRMLDTIQQMPYDLGLPDSVEMNWEALLSDRLVHRYRDAITYQLRYLTKFILENGDEDDIFILIGDHQPALLCHYGKDGFHTPMHVIAKDSAFVQGFAEHGFFEGMEIQEPGDKKRRMQHAGFYSLFMSEFLGRYGQGQPQLPVDLKGR